MNWHLAAAVAQLLLIALFLATQVRSGRRGVGEVLLYAVPMVGLAVGTALGVSWVMVAAAVFYSVWLVNHALSWRRPDPAPDPSHRRRTPAALRAVVGLLSVAALALTWAAVLASSVRPVV